ncbi:MAG: metal-dependent hydrolase [Marinilabiliales bacterium]|nr:MAG: metal-dependent hydrolase [Marinilabiliales bacterium]
MKRIAYLLLIILLSSTMILAQELQTDKFDTNKGELAINFVNHGSLFFEFDGKVIHIDPVTRMGNYEEYPKADLILITHQHGDHLDLNAIHLLKKESTKIIFTKKCQEMSEDLSEVIVMNNGDILNINQLEIEAIPAYNIKHKRENGNPFHPQGEGNGYVINFANKKVLVAGDTENIPEIKALENIDIAFLPMNLPYTMTPEMVAEAAKAFKPKVLYPYHYGETDTSKLKELLKDEKEIEVRIKKM